MVKVAGKPIGKFQRYKNDTFAPSGNTRTAPTQSSGLVENIPLTNLTTGCCLINAL